ncbi:T6SS effector BTH_I2691 family protein [Alcanivorax sp. 24]|uniref:T6SS effector BTH_I2691 family protein n=1 Tax=Alcanivorax sp. 24 TaxID=2545266 RepID=UPI00105BBF14|nr:T6SS effector BTH_I2691 family protein [Alcanivorax sp. 24]
MSEPAATCPFCQKTGLPIMPVRYAVARTDGEEDSQAFDLPSEFGEGIQGGTGVTLPASSAKYTTRLLRPGYLYAFNEVRGVWSAYVVTELGFLYEFDVEETTPPDASEIEFSCFRTGEEYMARCITIPDAENAGAIWFAFSDTAWTQDVLAWNRTEGNREKHMRKIDVGAWVAGNRKQPHAAPMDSFMQVINEYDRVGQDYGNSPASTLHMANPETGQPVALTTMPTIAVRSYPTFDFSPHQFHGFKSEAMGLLGWVGTTTQTAGAPPLMVALNDPVGVTAELAALMGARLRELMTEPDHTRPLAVSAAIESLREAIHDDAENRQIYETERAVRDVTVDVGHTAARMNPQDGGASVVGMALADLLFPSQREAREQAYERWRNPTPDQLAQARRDAWQTYEDKLRTEGSDGDATTVWADWKSHWRETLTDFDQRVIKPLAEAHVAWMRHSTLSEHLHASCDAKDVESGLGFVNAVLLCIQDTQEYKPCAEAYKQWLEAGTIEKSNLILSAMSFNQAAIVAELNSFSQGGLAPDSLKGLPWDRLIESYDNAVEAIGSGGKNAVARLAAAVGGPIAEVAGRAVDSVVGPGLVALGVIGKAPVIMVDVTMPRANAIAELVARMTVANGQVGDLQELNRAIDIQMRKAEIYGAPEHGTGRFRYLIMADPRVVEDFPGVDEQGGARRFAESALLTEADRRRLTQLRWRQLLPGAAGLGIVTGILQMVALGKLAEDVDRSMAHEANENSRRYGTAVAGLIGTLGETVGKWSESAAQADARLARIIEKYVGKALRVIGRGLGITTGVAMAVFDFYRGDQEMEEGNFTAGRLFQLSGALSVGAMFAFWLGATGIGIVLVVLVIVIAVLIEIFKDNKIQDWLERCYFGKFDERDRYQALETELAELDVALKG